ncbi:MAG TPA: NAD-dependent epimerase/dehydratase family protein [Bacteroidales bacterium]|nr:NAD-dependent epimerase/dehydratase family protein [Bacteroidales bacterium]
MIFVTGSTGLVGAHLLFQLSKNGNKIKALVRNPEKINRIKHIFSYYTDNANQLLEKIEWIKGDILDPATYFEALKDVHTVYHCAAMVSFDKKDKSELFKTNIEGTANLVNVSLEQNVNKMCFVSSVAALGESQNGEAVTEENYWVPSKNRSPYAISKYKSEMEIWRGVQEGLNAVIVNPSVILGPGFWDSGSGLIFTKAAKGMLFYTTGTTGFVDVRDVVRAMIKLSKSNIFNQRFILNAENIVYKDLFDMISEAVSAKEPKMEATRLMLNIARIMDALLSNLRIKKRELTKDIVKSSLSKSKYSNEKIKHLLKMDFIPVQKTIEEMTQFYKQDLTGN